MYLGQNENLEGICWDTQRYGEEWKNKTSCLSTLKIPFHKLMQYFQRKHEVVDQVCIKRVVSEPYQIKDLKILQYTEMMAKLVSKSSFGVHVSW